MEKKITLISPRGPECKQLTFCSRKKQGSKGEKKREGSTVGLQSIVVRGEEIPLQKKNNRVIILWGTRGKGRKIKRNKDTPVKKRKSRGGGGGGRVVGRENILGLTFFAGKNAASTEVGPNILRKVKVKKEGRNGRCVKKGKGKRAKWRVRRSARGGGEGGGGH